MPIFAAKSGLGSPGLNMNVGAPYLAVSSPDVGHSRWREPFFAQTNGNPSINNSNPCSAVPSFGIIQHSLGK